jgi:uncharacterized protein YjbI with pentapeptide repeats
MAPDIDAPRLRPVDPSDLTVWDPTTRVLPGDALEAVRVPTFDVAGERLTDLDVEDCVFGTVRADETDLRGLRIRDSVIEMLDAPVLRAARTTWQRVEVRAGRVGSAELYDTVLDEVVFSGLKLGFVNLRAAKLRDVLFRDCVIDELDLDGAALTRVAFDGCTIREVAGRSATIEHVDLRGAELDRVERLEGLRGATISVDQVYALAPMLAVQAGFRVT